MAHHRLPDTPNQSPGPTRIVRTQRAALPSSQVFRTEARKPHSLPIRKPGISPLRANLCSVFGWICKRAAASSLLSTCSKTGVVCAGNPRGTVVPIVSGFEIPLPVLTLFVREPRLSGAEASCLMLLSPREWPTGSSGPRRQSHGAGGPHWISKPNRFFCQPAAFMPGRTYGNVISLETA